MEYTLVSRRHWGSSELSWGTVAGIVHLEMLS